jgi:hypothetical protein
VAGRVQRRIRTPQVAELVYRAKQLRHAQGTPFWDTLFGLAADTDPTSQAEVLELAQFHRWRKASGAVAQFGLDEASVEVAVRSEIEAAADDEVVALSSRVMVSDAAYHIPMIDYRVPVNNRSTAMLTRQLAAMNCSGWLIDSGRSYHFIGRTLLHGDLGYSRFMGRALLYAPIVDARWIAHQLLEGAAALRISGGNGDEQREPVVIADVA